MAPRVSNGTPEWRPTGEVQLDDRGSILECNSDVTIALPTNCRLCCQCAVKLAWLRGGVDYRVKLIDLDVDQIGGIFGHIRIGCEDCSHGFAGIPHVILGQHRLPEWRKLFIRSFAKIDWR